VDVSKTAVTVVRFTVEDQY